MQTDNTVNTDTSKQDESLEDAAKIHEITNPFSESHQRRFDFKSGANWQKEKDNVIIDKIIEDNAALLEALRSCFVILESMARYPDAYPLWEEDKSKERYQKALEAIQKAESKK